MARYDPTTIGSFLTIVPQLDLLIGFVDGDDEFIEETLSAQQSGGEEFRFREKDTDGDLIDVMLMTLGDLHMDPGDYGLDGTGYAECLHPFTCEVET